MSRNTAVDNSSPSTSFAACETSGLPRQHQLEVMFKNRVVSIDLRIGLNLLGENGRMLLAEYIKTKASQPAC